MEKQKQEQRQKQEQKQSENSASATRPAAATHGRNWPGAAFVSAIIRDGALIQIR